MEIISNDQQTPELLDKLRQQFNATSYPVVELNAPPMSTRPISIFII